MPDSPKLIKRMDVRITVAIIGAVALVVAALIALLKDRPDPVPDPDPARISQDFRIDAGADWMRTAYRVEAGRWYGVKVDGKWCYNRHNRGYGDCGPDGRGIAGPGYTLPGAHEGELLGRIGDANTPFAIGKGFMKTLPLSGFLWLRINDNDLTDNDGAVHLVIINKP